MSFHQALRLTFPFSSHYKFHALDRWRFKTRTQTPETSKMPFRRKRTRTLESPIVGDEAQTQSTKKLSEYERSREERIKENLERMEKLGIVNLSLKLKAATPKRQAAQKAANRSTPAPSSGPLRRSSRLQNVTPVTYSEAHLAKKEEGILLEEGAKPEAYTEEHEKLLGNTERSWTLFVDGYKDGERIYDRVNGKTCHQCRQKTLGHRTNCCKCNLVQGQFCGDCLYMRYGEHVLEAMENPNWICPACRGICNCSLCRQAKGWPPTGMLYKKISNLGYKSVAHYLIQTRKVQSNLGEISDAANLVSEISDAANLVSAKRSLSFSGEDALTKVPLKINDTEFGSLNPQPENKIDDAIKSEKENEMKSSRDPSTNDNQVSAKRSLHFSVVDHDQLKLKPQSEEKRGDEFNGEEEKELNSTDEGYCENNGPDDELLELNEKSSDIKQAINNNLSEQEVEKKMEMSSDKMQSVTNIALESALTSGYDDDLPGMNLETSDVKRAVNITRSTEPILDSIVKD